MTQSTFPRSLEAPQAALRIGLGLAAFLAGLDKFVGLLADWPAYLAPTVAAVLPVSPDAFMHLAGLVEMAVGVAILTRWPREGALVAMAWLVLVAGNLVLGGRFFDVAVRDVEMAIAAFALARLTGAREAAPATAEVRATTGARSVEVAA